jgi:hypothetical protein
MPLDTLAIASQVGLQKSIIQVIIAALANNWIFITVVLIIAILFIVALLSKGKLLIKLPGGTSVDIGSAPDNSSKNKPIVSEHSECAYVVDFKHVVSKTTYIVSKISEITYKGCLSEQTNYLREQLVNIRTMYQKSYLDKLKDKIKENDKEDKYLFEDYRYYQAIIKLMLHDIEAVIRSSFDNNHLISYKPDEYQKYIDLKFNVIKGLEADFIDSMYIGNWVVTRDEVFEIHRSKKDELQRIISDVYMRAQKISYDKKNEIDRLQEELQEFVDVTTSRHTNK